MTESSIVLNFKASNKTEALELMLEHLVKQNKLDAERKQEALNALIAREKVATTAVENGVAFPHAACGAIDELIAFIAVSSNGVPFDAPDGKNTHILALLLVPFKERGKYARTLTSIATILNKNDVRQAILNASTAAQVYNIIKAEELKLG